MKEKNKTVLFVAPHLGGGGAERVMCTLANGLLNRGYSVKIALVIKDTIAYSLDPKIDVMINKGNHGSLGQIRFIRKLMKKTDGTVISFLTYQNLYTLLAGIGLHKKIIVSERNDPSTTLLGREKYLERLRSLLYRSAYRVVFQTPDARDYFSKPIIQKGVIIENPIRQDLPEVYHGAREKRFVAFSRLNPQKNIPMMFKALVPVFEAYPEYTLDFFGQGEMLEELMALSEQLGIREQIHFKGFAKDVLSQCRTAAAFLSSSDYEGISNSMLEAMAIGLPVICTDCPCGGARMNIISGENGLLVPVGDADAMTKAILSVMEDPSLAVKLSQNAVLVREKLKSDAIINQWENLL